MPRSRQRRWKRPRSSPADGNDTNDESARFDDRSVEPGVWRYARASRATVIVDAADYFALMQQAMLKAQRRIMLIGWDFDTRIHLAKGRRWWQRGWNRDYPRRLGSFILWLGRHRPELEIRILKWSFGFIKFFGRGMMLVDIARWARHKRIEFKFDTAHPHRLFHDPDIAFLDGLDGSLCGCESRHEDKPGQRYSE
jgi:hypothetical protein